MKELDLSGSLYHIGKHRNHPHLKTAKSENNGQIWPLVPPIPGVPTRRIALGNQPRLLRELLQRVLEKTPGLQIIPHPILWPYRQREQSQAENQNDSVNWLILTPSAVPWSQSSALPAIRACNPLSILTLSENAHQVSIQPRTIDGYVIKREYSDISLQMLLSILRYAPEASHSYTQASYN